MINLIKSRKYLLSICVILLLVSAVLCGTFASTKEANAYAWSVITIDDTKYTPNTSLWSADSTATTFTSTNTDWMSQFYVTSGAESYGDYTMTADFKANTATPTGETQMGFVPWYYDANNYLAIYMKWNAGETALKEIVVHSKVGGSWLNSNLNTSGGEWHSIWFDNLESSKYSMSNSLNPNTGLSLKVVKEHNTATGKYQLKVYLKGATEDASGWAILKTVTLNNYTDSGAQAKVGFYTRNDTVTISNFTFEKTFNGWVDGAYVKTLGTTNVWSYDSSSKNLNASGGHANSWKNAMALRTNTMSSYWVSANLAAYVPATPISGANQQELYVGLVPFYLDSDNNVFVWLVRWTDSKTVTLVISAWINGAAPTAGEFASIDMAASVYQADIGNLMEVQISGDTVNVYFNRSSSAVLSHTVNGLGLRVAECKGYYGAYVMNTDASFYNLTQTASRSYGGLETPVISVKNKVTTGYVNEAINIDAMLFTGKVLKIPTVTVTNASGTAQTVYHKPSAIKGGLIYYSPFYFYPTTAGTYTVKITGTDRFGQTATAVSYTITVSAPTALKYTVKYNSNGGTGTMSNSSITYGVGTALTANAFTRTGYTFSGWAQSASGSKVYSNSQTVTNIAYPEETITLYAVWTPNTYTVSYNSNGGSGTMANQTFTYGVSQALTANAFTKAHYTFGGWATTQNGAKVYSNSQSISVSANTTLYALTIAVYLCTILSRCPTTKRIMCFCKCVCC